MLSHHGFIGEFMFHGSKDGEEALMSALDQCLKHKKEWEREAKHKVGETVLVTDDLFKLEEFFFSCDNHLRKARETARDILSQEGLVISVEKLEDHSGKLTMLYTLEIRVNRHELCYILPDSLIKSKKEVK